MNTDSPYNASQPTDSAPETEMIAYRGWAGSWRAYLQDNDDNHVVKSEWIFLNATESYYLRGEHVNWAGAEHMTVSVEIRPNLTTNETSEADDLELFLAEHPKATHTLQRIALEQ